MQLLPSKPEQADEPRSAVPEIMLIQEVPVVIAVDEPVQGALIVVRNQCFEQLVRHRSAVGSAIDPASISGFKA